MLRWFVLFTFAALAASQSSCVGRCALGTDPDASCQCNPSCIRFDDCCADYEAVCLTCENRCNSPVDNGRGCQCNSACTEYNDCCDDYDELCDGGGGGDEITDSDLYALSANMWAADVNNVGDQIEYDLSGPTLFPAGLPPGLEDQGTWTSFFMLLDNYFADVNDEEDVTATEEAEEENFLNAVFSTSTMQLASNFLQDKGVVASEQALREKMKEMWFGLYSRSSVLGSSGFEHVFLGEIRGTSVTGFHGWVYFAQEEAIGDMDYGRELGSVEIQDKGVVLELTFQWEGNNKPISSIFVGASPEFEMGVMTVCWLTRPNSLCPAELASGVRVNVQTYVEEGRYVGSAYFDIS